MPATTPNKSESLETTISGPSFLGLAAPRLDDPGYLLDDQPSHRHRGWVAFSVIAIALLGGIGVLEWRAMNGLSLPWIASSPKAAPASSIPATPIPPDHSPYQPDATSTTAGSPPAQKDWGAVSSPASNQTEEERQEDLKATQNAESRQARESHDQKTGDFTDDASDMAAGLARPDGPPIPSGEANLVPTPAEPIPASTTPDPRKNPMLLLGEKYLYGQGVSRNCPQAVVYFKAAAERDIAPAMLHLGAIYASGVCVPLDRVTAFHWFRKAQLAEPHNPWIAKNMDILWREMSPQERSQVPK